MELIQPAIQRVPEFFPRPWHIVDHSPPSRTNVKNMWSNNSAPLYALMAWTRTNLPLPYPYSNPGTKTNHSAPRCLQVSPGKCRYNIVKQPETVSFCTLYSLFIINNSVIRCCVIQATTHSFVIHGGVCYNEPWYKERMLRRTVFINKIRMLQRTRKNTIGRRCTRVRMTCQAFSLLLERQS